MNTSTIRGALDLAKGVVQDTREMVRQGEGGTVNKDDRPRLSQKQQVDRYMKLSDTGHEALRLRWGNDQYERYTKHMLNLARRGV